MNKNILVIGIQVVMAFLGAFGAVLKDILPNQIESKPLIYGITQFCCLFVFFILKALFFKNKTIRKSHWIVFACMMFATFILSSWFFYNHQRNAIMEVASNTQEIIIGSELSKSGNKICAIIKKAHPDLTLRECQQMFLDEGTVADAKKIWTEASINNNKDKFVLFYVLMIISLSAAMFSLVELLSAGGNENPTPAAAG